MIIVEDGTDLRGFRTKEYNPAVDDYKQIKINLNKYLLKYDYEVAGTLAGQTNNKYAFCKENQRDFNEKAFQELLEECS